MKLVQLLAKELKEWPESAKYITQEDDDGSVTLWYRAKPKYKSGEWVLDRHLDDSDYAYILHGIDTASDNKKSIVTQDQWKAEREKMNKPKWIRHRGGNTTLHPGTMIEARLRSGEIQRAIAGAFLWDNSLSDHAVKIMAYRIIEETKDQEIKQVKDTNIGTLTYKLEVDTSSAMTALNELSTKWGQLESPLKWRYEIIELEAYEEEFRREREKLIRKLESEGFKLIDHVAPVYGEAIIGMEDYKNWRGGDIVEVTSYTIDGQFTLGRTYAIASIRDDHLKFDCDDSSSSNGWYARNFKFIRRP